MCPLIKKKVVDFNKKKFKLCPKLCYSAIQPRVQACLVRSQVDEEEEYQLSHFIQISSTEKEEEEEEEEEDGVLLFTAFVGIVINY